MKQNNGKNIKQKEEHRGKKRNKDKEKRKSKMRNGKCSQARKAEKQGKQKLLLLVIYIGNCYWYSSC